MRWSLPASFRRWGPPTHLLLPVLILGGCGTDGGGSSGPSGYAVRDSSGITIVGNAQPTWEGSEPWRVSPDPLLSIGVLSGPEEYILFRVSHAIRMGDGRVLVVNSGTRELRFYDAQGTFLHATGSEGEGPGEFRSMGFARRTELDSLVVYDFRLRRFSVFDENGIFARNFQLGQGTGELAFPEGAFADGTVLASVDEQDQGDYSDLGMVRGRSRYGRYDGEGGLMESLASLPGSELYHGVHPDGSGFTTSASHAVRPYAAAGRSTWFYGSGDAFEFQEWGKAGRLLRIIRLDLRRRATPDAVRAAWEESLRRMRPEAAALWRAVPLPDSLPTHGELMVDREGNLWIQGYVVLEEEPYWSILDPSGRWLGDLTPPEGLRVTEAGADYLMGIWADSLGVQQVRIYGLEKPGGL